MWKQPGSKQLFPPTETWRDAKGIVVSAGSTAAPGVGITAVRSVQRPTLTDGSVSAAVWLHVG